MALDPMKACEEIKKIEFIRFSVLLLILNGFNFWKIKKSVSAKDITAPETSRILKILFS